MHTVSSFGTESALAAASRSLGSRTSGCMLSIATCVVGRSLGGTQQEALGLEKERKQRVDATQESAGAHAGAGAGAEAGMLSSSLVTRVWEILAQWNERKGAVY